MSCRHLACHAPAPGFWHRLWCSECRTSRAADATLALGTACMKAQPFPEAGLKRTLGALDLPYSPVRQGGLLHAAKRRLLKPVIALLTFLMAAGYGWARYVDRQPTVPASAPTVMPTVNAYATYQKAGAALQEQEKVHILVREARENLIEYGKPIDAEGRHDDREQKRRLVKRNAQALAYARQGLTLPYQEPPVRSFHTPLAHYTTYRTLAQLMELEADLKADEGKWNESVSAGLDAIQLGTQIPQGGPLVGKLAGIACQTFGRKAVWAALKHLSAKEARDAATRLEKILAQSVPLAETLRQEKWTGLATLKNDVLKPGWRRSFSSWMQPYSTYPTGNESRLQNAFWYLYLLRYSNQEIVDNYARYMDALAIRAEALPINLDQVPVPNDPVGSILTPVFSGAGMQELKSATMNRLLLTALALRAYYKENGEYPHRLEQLFPAYLQTLRDPFMPGKLLSYRNYIHSYVLYSYGPDQKDDGGVPIHDPHRRSVEQYNIQQESLGDIVVGRL